WGADQIFARAVLALPGSYEVVLPAHDYRDTMIAQGHGTAFDELVARAADVDVMPFARSCRLAYLAASIAMLDRCDQLLALWDGRPPQQVGDTAHVVAVARQLGIPVTVAWPHRA